MKNVVLSLLLIATVMFSCSVVKNPSASHNFKRVKYNSHLKLAKSEVSVNAHDNKKMTKESKAVVTAIEEAKVIEPQTLTKSHSEIVPLVKEEAIASSQLKDNFTSANLNEVKVKVKELSNLLVTQESKKTAVDSWWEIDPEDWTLEQILLAAIAVLLVILAIYLLVELLGGVVGSILGLIILLLLAYLLIQYLS